MKSRYSSESIFKCSLIIIYPDSRISYLKKVILNGDFPFLFSAKGQVTPSSNNMTEVDFSFCPLKRRGREKILGRGPSISI
jgi:hypothetical protein